MQCTQYAIFEEVAKAQVDACIQGYNATIFAYGQTGTGKTYTMEVRACSAAISLAKRAPGAARRAEKSRRRCFSHGRKLMPRARDRDFLGPNILCLEHHVPIPYDPFTNPKLQDLFFLLGDFFFSYWGILFFLAGVSAPRCRP